MFFVYMTKFLECGKFLSGFNLKLLLGKEIKILCIRVLIVVVFIIGNCCYIVGFECVLVGDLLNKLTCI